MTLMASGKSSRLAEMRQKSMQAHPNDTTAANGLKRGLIPPADKYANPGLLLARQMIDQRLQEILAGFPTGRQRSLFKIRYGADPENLKHRPIRDIVKLLHIRHPQLTDPRSDLQSVLDMTYNGESV